MRPWKERWRCRTTVDDLSTSSGTAPLYLRKMDTGEVTPIAGTENGILPFFSPDGEWIGFYSDADAAIKKVALSGGSPITIDKVPQPIRGATWSRETPSGGLLAVPFDADALKITGAPIPVADEVGGWDRIGIAFADVASDGTLVYASPNLSAEQRELVWIDRKGAATPISAGRRDYQQAKLSPDGAQLAVVVEEHGRRDLWLYEFRRELWRRLTTGDVVITVVWSPDSSQIFFSSGRSGSQGIYSMPIDGGAPARDITRDKANWQMPVSVSPDNRYVLVMRQQRESLHILLAAILPLAARWA